jgi:hypothetical protein
MKATEVRDEIQSMEKRLSQLSDMIAADKIEKDGICFRYLGEKFKSLGNTAHHIESQLEFKHDPTQKRFNSKKRHG